MLSDDLIKYSERLTTLRNDYKWSLFSFLWNAYDILSEACSVVECVLDERINNKDMRWTASLDIKL